MQFYAFLLFSFFCVCFIIFVDFFICTVLPPFFHAFAISYPWISGVIPAGANRGYELLLSDAAAGGPPDPAGAIPAQQPRRCPRSRRLHRLQVSDVPTGTVVI